MRRVVAQAQAVNLHGVADSAGRGRNENGEFLSDRMAVVLEHGVTLAVAGAIGVLLPNRRRGGRPESAALLVAQINRLRLRVGHGIVVPRRQPVRLTVPAPGATEAALTHYRAE